MKGTGRFKDWDVSAVYRAVGYLSDKLPKLPWDLDSGTVPDQGGRVLQESGEHLRSTYVTGWIRRGPVGLIGHTKGDANETVANLLEDYAAGRLDTPETPARRPWTRSSPSAASASPPGTAGTAWTPRRRRWARRRAARG
ncbi:hypothetical protein SHKM778_52450 [Streptomyces sp. KM77-8]|uniref:Uncharacterized protein n=1 Tax=Streptomyces haneummycinicus TaxID=3074435 RepID=A0AAT9HN43_9ACTN